MGQPSSRAPVLAVLAVILLNSMGLDGQEPFRSGVVLVNVTATVTDRSGRFVAGLQQSDFVVYEDDQPVEITHFTAERVPVSLGIVLDTSGSMAGRKMDAARAAVRRLLVDLLGPQDEFFLYRFDHTPHLVEGWTNDRRRMTSALQRMHPEGATALYDAVAKALPLLQSGRHRKKALLVISDGIDTSSDTSNFVETDVVAASLVNALRHQYVLAIEAANSREWRRLDVRVKRRAATVRARSGYFGG